MGNFVFNKAAKMIMDGSLDLLNDTLRLMLVNDTYTPDRDDDYVDAGGADDPLDAEIVATNYTGGHQGAGRKAVNTSKTITEDDANDLAKFDAADPATWSSLGGGDPPVNDTIQAAILIRDGTSDDTDALLITYFDTAVGTPPLPHTTTGGDFTLQINALGLINFQTNPS